MNPSDAIDDDDQFTVLLARYSEILNDSGIVFLAFDPEPRREVAVKVPHLADNLDDGTYAMGAVSLRQFALERCEVLRFQIHRISLWSYSLGQHLHDGAVIEPCVVEGGLPSVLPIAEVMQLPPDLLRSSACRVREKREVRIGFGGFGGLVGTLRRGRIAVGYGDDP